MKDTHKNIMIHCKCILVNTKEFHCCPISDFVGSLR
jgi:hypothetical protein